MEAFGQASRPPRKAGRETAKETRIHPPQRRVRRSREEVRDALVDAAAELLATTPSGHVTVRAIAAAADVNPTFVHRYFGSKRGLIEAAMQRAKRNVTLAIDEMPDVIEGATAVVRATLAEKEFIAAIARATLDGTLDVLPRETPAMARLLERFRAERESGGAQGRHDPRVVVACLTGAAMGYALFAPFLRQGLDLRDEPDDRLEAALVSVLQDVARLAFRE